eukprot:5088334-Pyramimonas_sp.AAC.1
MCIRDRLGGMPSLPLFSSGHCTSPRTSTGLVDYCTAGVEQVGVGLPLRRADTNLTCDQIDCGC